MRGGKRPGAGRRKGSINKVPRKQKESLAALLAEGGETPMAFLLREMRAKPPVQQEGENTLAFVARYQAWDRRTMAAAIAVAPFRHPKLSSIEHKGEGGGPIQHRTELVFVEPTKK